MLNSISDGLCGPGERILCSTAYSDTQLDWSLCVYRHTSSHPCSWVKQFNKNLAMQPVHRPFATAPDERGSGELHSANFKEDARLGQFSLR
jgi:hypothetical protein